jgi:hypothetical protein
MFLLEREPLRMPEIYLDTKYRTDPETGRQDIEIAIISCELESICLSHVHDARQHPELGKLYLLRLSMMNGEKIRDKTSI